MANTATADTDTDLDTKYGYHVKAKNAHDLCDVSKFARIDTCLLSGNTASATSTVYTGRHNSTLKNTALQHGGCMICRRYSRFTARLTVAGDTPQDLATRRWLTPLATISMTAASCSSDNRRRAPSVLPSAFAVSKPALARRPNRPGYGPRTTLASRGRHPGNGPRTVRCRPGRESSPRAAADRGCCPRCPANADRCGRWKPQPRYNQGIALSQPGVQRVPAPPAVSPGGPVS